jgi:hypothetical protein
LAGHCEKEKELCHCDAVLLSWSYCHFYLTPVTESVVCHVDATDDDAVAAQEVEEEEEEEVEMEVLATEIVVEDTR